MNTVDLGFQQWFGRTKIYNKIGIFYFSEHAVLINVRSKSRDYLAQNQDNVFEWSNMSTYSLVSVS
jgi:hypothetical protein